MAQGATKYSTGFKARMVQRLSAPERESGASLSRETGVPQSTLSRWRNQAGRVRVRGVMHEGSMTNDARPGAVPRRPKDWSAEEKLRFVVKAMTVSDEELGELLRRSGLHEADYQAWKTTMLGALKVPAKRGSSSKERKKLQKLERELRRKDKALAETAALLVLQGKTQALWGDEGDDT